MYRTNGAEGKEGRTHEEEVFVRGTRSTRCVHKRLNVTKANLFSENPGISSLRTASGNSSSPVVVVVAAGDVVIVVEAIDVDVED